MAKRKTYSAETKVRAVLELLREKKSLTQVTAEYGMHPTSYYGAGGRPRSRCFCADPAVEQRRTATAQAGTGSGLSSTDRSEVPGDGRPAEDTRPSPAPTY